MRVLIFPNDPLSVYVSKGEVKKLYFNPGNLFKEITIVNFGGSPVRPEAILYATGNARVDIINLPKLSIFAQLFPYVSSIKLNCFER